MPRPTNRGTIPQTLLKRIENQFGPHFSDTIVEGLAASRPATFRVNTLRATDNQIMDELRATAVRFERVKEIPHAFLLKDKLRTDKFDLPLAAAGKIYAQGLASMLPPIILDPKPGEAVLDFCAAPGSKTSQLAAIMNNAGRLVAFEKDEIRFQKLQNTLDLQGVKAEAYRGDAALLAANFPEQFDKVLLDAPCSAEGRINLNDPRSYRFWSEKNITAHAKIQRRLLRAALSTVKPGGILVYSTCTLAPAENEDMIRWLIATYPEWQIEKISSPLPGLSRPESFYLLPSNRHEGMFISRLKRKT